MIESGTFEATLLSETFLIHCFSLCLSTIHYNENSDRLQKVTADGRPKYAIKYLKSRKWGHSLIPVKSAAIYGSRFVTYCLLYIMNYSLSKCKKKKTDEVSNVGKKYLK